MEEIYFEINGAVTPSEIIAVREDARRDGDEAIWHRCIEEALCVVTARDSNTRELLGIGFVIGNARHGQLVDLTVHSKARQKGIGGKLVDKMVAYAKEQGIRYVGLTYDTKSPWLKPFYERHGFQSIDFAMWERGSLP